MANGNSAALTRRYNRTVVLDALRRGGSLSRVELARLSGLTPQGIRNIVEDLLETGLVRETGRRRGLRGQPQIDIELNPEAGYCLGLHIAGEQCAGLAADLGGTIICSTGPFPFKGGKASMRETLARIENETARQAGGTKRLGTGVVFSRPLASRWSATGESVDQQDDQQVALEEFFGGGPLVFDNDANAAAMAELAYGQPRRQADFLYLFIGEGVGGAVIQGGLPFRGAHNNAGEFGHILIDPAGPTCHCGNKGCLHGYLSLASLRASMAPRSGFDPTTVPDLWLDTAATALRRAVISLENIFDPPGIVIGGTAPPWLLRMLGDRLSALGTSVRSDQSGPRVEISDLGDRCALLGASALPLLAITNPSLTTLTKDIRAPHTKT